MSSAPRTSIARALAGTMSSGAKMRARRPAAAAYAAIAVPALPDESSIPAILEGSGRRDALHLQEVFFVRQERGRAFAEGHGIATNREVSSISPEAPTRPRASLGGLRH